MDDAVLYMNVYYLGIIGNLIYNIGTGVLRAIGDSRMPLYVLIVCCLANVVLDLLFVVVFHWGVFGVAFATILSQLISAVLLMIRLMGTQEAYRVELRKIRFHKDILKNVVRIGLPAGLQSVMYSFSNILIQASINSFGTTAIAAWAAIGKIDGFIWMVMNAFGIAVTTFAGQNFGARQYEPHEALHACGPWHVPWHDHRAFRAAVYFPLSAFDVLYGRCGGCEYRCAVLFGIGAVLLYVCFYRDFVRRDSRCRRGFAADAHHLHRRMRSARSVDIAYGSILAHDADGRDELPGIMGYHGGDLRYLLFARQVA